MCKCSNGRNCIVVESFANCWPYLLAVLFFCTLHCFYGSYSYLDRSDSGEDQDQAPIALQYVGSGLISLVSFYLTIFSLAATAAV